MFKADFDTILGEIGTNMKLKEPTYSTDPDYDEGVVSSWATTDIIGYLDERGVGQTLFNLGPVEYGMTRIFLKTGVDVAIGDRILFNSTDYEVKEVKTLRYQSDVYKECEVVRVV